MDTLRPQSPISGRSRPPTSQDSRLWHASHRCNYRPRSK